MGATPIYALPYPAATDPADVPTDMQELADRLEALLGSARQTVLTGSGTYNVPAGTRALLVECIGGGGGGTGTPPGVSGQGAAAGGGAGGNYASKLILNPAASYPYSVGAGGTAGGGGGGASNFGSGLCVANGGGGASTTNVVANGPSGGGGNCGAAGTGDVLITGESGMNGYVYGGSPFPGIGGTAARGGGKQRASFATSAAGGPGMFPGNGGNGGFITGAVAGQVGGAGAAGTIIVTAL